MPDTPMLLFWVLSLYFLISLIDKNGKSESFKRTILLFGLTSGLAIVSKYHAVFLWFGLGLFILLYKKDWLRKIQLYLAALISLICIIPVFIWNLENDFISFKFQGERVNLFERGMRLDYFATEFFGQILYNNPFIFLLTVLALVHVFRNFKQYKIHGSNYSFSLPFL